MDLIIINIGNHYYHIWRPSIEEEKIIIEGDDDGDSDVDANGTVCTLEVEWSPLCCFFFLVSLDCQELPDDLSYSF